MERIGVLIALVVAALAYPRSVQAICPEDPTNVRTVPDDGATVPSDVVDLWMIPDPGGNLPWIVLDGQRIDGVKRFGWWSFPIAGLEIGRTYTYDVGFMYWDEERSAGTRSFTVGADEAPIVGPIEVEAVVRSICGWECNQGEDTFNECGATTQYPGSYECFSAFFDQNCWDLGPWVHFYARIAPDPAVAIHQIRGLGEAVVGGVNLYKGGCDLHMHVEDFDFGACSAEQCFEITAYDRRGLEAGSVTTCESGLDFGTPPDEDSATGETSETSETSSTTGSPPAADEASSGCGCSAPKGRERLGLVSLLVFVGWAFRVRVSGRRRVHRPAIRSVSRPQPPLAQDWGSR